MRMEMKFWFTISTKGESTRLCHSWKLFQFLAQVRGQMIACGGNKFFPKKETVFHFLSHDSPFQQKKCAMTGKHFNCHFLVLKRDIQNVAASFRE